MKGSVFSVVHDAAALYSVHRTRSSRPTSYRKGLSHGQCLKSPSPTRTNSQEHKTFWLRLDQEQHGGKEQREPELFFLVEWRAGMAGAGGGMFSL